MPALAPVSWIFQTLAIFFLVGGYAAARSYKGQYLTWLRARLVRLGRPVAVLAAVWVPLTAGDDPRRGTVLGTIHTMVTLVLDPLWFLGVFAGLTALTPLAVALVRRFGAAAALAPPAVVAGVDAGPVRPRRSRLARLGQRRGRLAGPLPARDRVGARGVPRLEGARRACSRRRRGRHRGAGRLGRVPGQHGGRERRPRSRT